jgi:hypothetical protein
VQATTPVTLELNPSVALPTVVADGCSTVPDGVIVVRLPPFSTDTTGPFVEEEEVVVNSVGEVDEDVVVSGAIGISTSRPLRRGGMADLLLLLMLL